MSQLLLWNLSHKIHQNGICPIKPPQNLAPGMTLTREAPEGNVAKSSGFPKIWAWNKNIPYSQTPSKVNPQGLLHTPKPKDLGGCSRFPGQYLHVLPVQGRPAVVDHGGLVSIEEGADLAEESSLWHQDIQS